MRRTVLRTILATIAAGALLVPQALTAAAQTASGLEVASISGREVSLILGLDPRSTFAPDTPTRGTVEIDGTVLPAHTSLEVTEDTRPNTAVLVLDASGSMAGARIGAARKAAVGFIDALPPEVAVGLVTFNDAVRVVSKPTTDREVIRRALEAVKPDGDTALYDAVARGIALAPEGSRARLVVLSDGKDTTSTMTLGAVNDEIAKAGVPVDVVAIRPSADERAVLAQMTDAGGGSLRSAATTDALVAAFADASKAFGARVLVTAILPDAVDASGKPITAVVAIGPEVFEGSTRLPVDPALAPAGVFAGRDPVSPTAIDAAAPSVVRDTVLPLLLAMLVAVCLFFVSFVVIKARHHARMVDRIEQVLRYRTGSQHTSASVARALDERPSRLAWLDALLLRTTRARKVQARLSAAEFDLTPAEWLLIRVGIGAVLAVIAGILLRSILAGLAIGAVLAWLGSLAVLQSRAAKRQRAFADSLPDFLMLLASGLRAGLSFTHALESAADEDRGEVGRQIRRALREVQVGASLDSALMECANRMENEDLRWTVTALAIQREVGGNLSSILDSAAATIKGRYELRREVRTLSAEGRLSAYILVALPLGVFAFLAVFRREYISLLWTDPLGIAMLVGLGLAMLVGWLWMRSIVRIRV